MTDIEKTVPQPDGLDPQESLSSQAKELSEKLDDDRLEEESIASAIVGNLGDEHESVNDIEKATTQATGTSHEPAQRVRTAVDWDGPDDPENPLNWPLLLRAYHTLSIGFLSFAVTAGSSLISPGTPEIEEHFQVSRTVAILPLTLYVLGLAFGPILAAPISETFGRNVVYKVTAPVFILFLLGSALSKSFGSLLVCRLLAGTVGGPVLAVGGGSTAVSHTGWITTKVTLITSPVSGHVSHT